MQPLNIQHARKIINKKLLSIARKNLDSNVLIGVAGCVASGKSRLSQNVRSMASTIFKKEPLYLPFDLWINIKGLQSPTYADRFFLDDFIYAVQCIAAGEQFFIPRYDLIKKGKLNLIVNKKQKIV
mgnify:FL=1